MRAWGIGIRRSFIAVAMCTGLIGTPCVVFAQSDPSATQPSVVHPWERLGAGLERIYGWPNILFHVSAAAVTPPLALWADEPVQEYFQRHNPLGGDVFGTVSLVVGGVAPIAVPAALYFTGLAAEENELATAGAAAIQAAVVQAMVVTTLKWLTDRAGPFPNGDPEARRWNSSVTRDSRSAKDFDFNPFDLKWGVRWPSGHTAGNIAIVSALVAFYPSEHWLPLVGYPAAFAIGIGMMEGDYHWLSDIVAGALIGHVIGWSIGREFRATYDTRKRQLRTEALTQGAPQQQPIDLGVMTQPLGVRVSGWF